MQGYLYAYINIIDTLSILSYERPFRFDFGHLFVFHTLETASKSNIYAYMTSSHVKSKGTRDLLKCYFWILTSGI